MNHLAFIGNIGFPETLLITLIVLLLFGGRKIPELMKGLGKGMRSFQQGLKGDDNDAAKPDDSGSENKSGDAEH